MDKYPIYMDNHATTPLDPRVFDAMLPYLKENFGNPASNTHAYGWRASEAIDLARASVAELLNCQPKEIIFTSGATESSNMAIKGVVLGSGLEKAHVISSQIEHNSVLDTLKSLEKLGHEVTYLMPQDNGCICLGDLERNIKENTILFSFMQVNNEIGSVNCADQIGKLAKNNNILFHCDAAQSLGRIKVNLKDSNIDMLSISGHKIYGPKGVGALFIKQQSAEKKNRFYPLMHGGGHEFGYRSGTLNVPGIAGLGEACRLLENFEAESEEIRKLKNKLWGNLNSELMSRVCDLKVNGCRDNSFKCMGEKVSGNLNVAFIGLESESLLNALSEDVALSASSACTSSYARPSHVLSAFNYKPERLGGSVRFGLGRFNTAEEVDFVSQRVCEEVKRLVKKKRKKLKTI